MKPIKTLQLMLLGLLLFFHVYHATGVACNNTLAAFCLQGSTYVYHAGTTPRTVADSKTYCSSLPPVGTWYLSRIESSSDRGNLYNYLINKGVYDRFWISATDINGNGDWEWTEPVTEPIQYSEWKSNQPASGSTLCARLDCRSGAYCFWESKSCGDSNTRPLCRAAGPTCPSTINVTSAGENLTSPGFPSFYDRAYLLCTLYRILPESDETLLVVFNVFSVDQYYQCQYGLCCRDYVKAWSNDLGTVFFSCSTVTGTGLSSLQIITNTELLLDLRRLGLVESQGFHATIETYDRNDCGGHFIAGSGYITSPSYPNNYPDRSACAFEIRAADTSHDVLLHFVEFELESHYACSWDRVKVRHEFSNGTTGEMTVCGSTLPADVIAKTISVFFSADAMENRRGFRAAYSVYQPPTIAPLALLDGNIELVNRNLRSEATTQKSASMTSTMPIETVMSTYITSKTNVEFRPISIESTVIFTEEIPTIIDISTGTISEQVATIIITDVRLTFTDISTEVNPQLTFIFTGASSTSTEILTETSPSSTLVPIETNSGSTDISTETILKPTETSSLGNSTEVTPEATFMLIEMSSSLTDTLANTISESMAFLTEMSSSSTEISTEPRRALTVMRTESVSSSTYTSTETSVISPTIPIDEPLHVTASLTEMTFSYMASASKISTESNLKTATANTLSGVVSTRMPAATGDLDSPTDSPGLFSPQSAIASPTQSVYSEVGLQYPTVSSSLSTTGASESNVSTSTSPAQLQCPLLPPMPNANVIYSVDLGFPLESGTAATVDCPEGYRLNTRQDNITLVCLGSLTWNLTANISCEIVKCSPPENFTGVTINVTSMEYMAQLSYTCENGSVFIDGSTTRQARCHASGKWLPSFAQCVSHRLEMPKSARQRGEPPVEATGAAVIGTFALGVCLAIVGTIVFLDIATLKHHLSRMKKNLGYHKDKRNLKARKYAY